VRDRPARPHELRFVDALGLLRLLHLLDAVITIHDFAFTTPASVSPGAKVSVHNTDGLAHTVTADEGKAFDSPAPAGNSSFTAPTAPGSYPFHCNIHPEMHGTLVVR